MNEIAAPGARRTIDKPDAYSNRAALSEAWYRALYGNDAKAHAGTQATPKSSTAASQPESRLATPGANSGTTGRKPTAVAAVPVRSSRQAFGVVRAFRMRAERNAPPTPAARLWRSAIARRLSVRVAVAGGTVSLLVQQRGRRIRVTALAERALVSSADAALQRARATLALHGFALEIDPAKGTA